MPPPLKRQSELHRKIPVKLLMDRSNNQVHSYSGTSPHERITSCSIGNNRFNLKPVDRCGWCGWSVFSWKRWKHGRIPGDSGHQTPTVLNKMAFVDITQRIRAHDCDSGRYPSFSTISTGFRVGWKSWSTKPTENSWFPIEHVKKTNQPNPVPISECHNHAQNVRARHQSEA